MQSGSAELKIPVMNIELTAQQQQALDREDQGPKRMIDPRSRTAYILVPESQYEAMRELAEDDKLQQAVHAVGLRNAAERLNEAP